MIPSESACPPNPRPSAPPPIEDVARWLAPHYVPLALAGKGVSAFVYKVRETAGGEARVVKLTWLYPGEAGRSQFAELAAEFLLAARISHPNLVRYYDLQRAVPTGVAVQVMEFVDGEPLRASGPGIVSGTIGPVFVQILRALQILHDFGFVHGDVKPANILCALAPDAPRAKLLDYHLTYRPADVDFQSSRGTLRYLSPEAIKGEAVDSRSDLYSVGVLLYEVLAGRPLFEGAPSEVARQHISAAVPALESADEARLRLHAIACRLLNKHPSGRYRSATEAARDILRAVGSAEPPETTVTLMARLNSVPLVGRERAAAAIRGFLAGERAGAGPGVLWITGRPGVGRTRLLRECELLAKARGNAVIRLPARLDADRMAAAIEKALGCGGGEGDSSHAHVRPTPGSAGVTLSESLDTARMLRLGAALERLDSAARDRTVLLIADDLQDAAPGGLAALMLGVRSSPEQAAKWCLSSTTAAALPAFFKHWRSSLVAEGRARHLDVGELEPDARRELVAAALPASLETGLSDQVADACSGTPAALLNVVEHVIRSGALALDDSAEWRSESDLTHMVPEALATACEEAYRQSAPIVRHVMEMIAASAGGIELGRIATILGMPAESLSAEVERSAASRVISFSSADHGIVLRFQHQAAKPRILERLDTAQRISLHDRLAASCGEEDSWQALWHALQGSAPAQAAARLAELLDRNSAGLPPDRVTELVDLALAHAQGAVRLTLLEKGADAARNMGNYALAEALFSECLGLITCESERGRILRRKLAVTCVHLKRFEEARAMIERDEAQPWAQDPPERMNLLIAAADIELRAAQYDRAHDNAVAALQLARELHDTEAEPRCEHVIANVLLQQGKLPEATAGLLRSLRGYRFLSDRTGIGAAMATLGETLMRKGDASRAIRFAERAGRLTEASGRLAEAARLHAVLGASHQRSHDWRTATDKYKTALALYRRIGHVHGQALMLANLSQVSARSGYLEDATYSARGAERLSEGAPEDYCLAAMAEARAEFQIGNLQRVQRTAQQVAALASDARLGRYIEASSRLLGEIAGLKGDWDKAEKYLRAALDRPGSSSMRRVVCLVRLAEIFLQAGQRKEVPNLLKSAREDALGIDTPLIHVLVETLQGRLALDEGDLKTAITLLISAQRRIAALDIWDETADISLKLGTAYQRLGRFRFASFYYRTALDTVEQVGARLRNKRNRDVFYSDPRRVELFESILAFSRLTASEPLLLEGDAHEER